SPGWLPPFRLNPNKSTATCGIVCFAERIACRTRNSNSVLPETVGAPVSIVEFNSSLPVRKLQKRCCSGNLGTYRFRQQWLCHTERWILVDVSRSIKPRRYIGCYYRLAEKTFKR